jgi:hypothetical protein
MPSQPLRPIDRPKRFQSWTTLHRPETLQILNQEQNRPRRVLARRLVTLSALIATGTMLGGCAASMFDSSSSNETMSQSHWEGPMKPRTTRTTFVRNGSQPILPPVPADNDGLPPVKVSSLLD